MVMVVVALDSQELTGAKKNRKEKSIKLKL